jgi:hypothetical protein
MHSLNVEDGALRLTLERFLATARSRSVEVTGWRRKPSPVAIRGVFPIEVLHVTLRGGEEVALFLKQLGAEQSDHPDKQCRDREPRIYDELLRDEGLPVPRYYGSRWNAATSRRELYLEYIDDWSLKYQSLDTWFPAARRLAQLHAHFAGRVAELAGCDYLLRLDAAYFHAWANRALAAVAEQERGLAGLLATVVDGYDRIADILCGQPVTLVHNDLAPKNVLADRSRQPPRICFIDWELAGVGCGLLDLVHLKHGLDPVSDRMMCTAYREELRDTGLLPASERELHRLFAACELHQTITLLAHSRSWRLPPTRLSEWVTAARGLAAEL